MLSERRNLRGALHRITAAATFVTALLGAPSAAQAEGGIRKGPWLMAPRTGSVTVMVELDRPGPITVRAWRLGPAGSPQSQPLVFQHDALDPLHEVHVTGLQAGARYRYEVAGPSITTVAGTFNTAPETGEPFRFVLYGDTRSNFQSHAATMRAIHREAPDFVVHTGDLVADGRRESDWQGFFETETELLRNAMFVPVIGNHEIRHASREGIENFRRYVHCPPPDSPRPELDYDVVYGNVRLVLANAYDDFASAPMRDWLESRLAQARQAGPDDFLIVVMHWGMNSSGPHGENRALRGVGLQAMFRRYGVDLIVAGHDHIYERGEEDGLRYLVTGGSGAPIYRHERHNRYTQVFLAQHHYVRVDAETNKLTFVALRPDGTEIDRFVIRHDGARAHAAAQRLDDGRTAPSAAAHERARLPRMNWPRVAAPAPIEGDAPHATQASMHAGVGACACTQPGAVSGLGFGLLPLGMVFGALGMRRRRTPS